MPDFYPFPLVARKDTFVIVTDLYPKWCLFGSTSIHLQGNGKEEFGKGAFNYGS
jgi:hypothetical protein